MPLLPRLQASDSELRAKFAALVTDADVADLLEVPVQQLRYILYEGRAKYAYRVFTIKKRHGIGERTIEAPPTTLRILQRKLLRVLTLVAKPRPPAHGFIKARSIRTNAQPHVGKRLVLNVDLEKFFPSINFGRVQHVFMSQPFSVGYAAATVLAQLCCREGALPQGAPTSPIVSNMICFRLDRMLRDLAKEVGWYYTRYADDLTFSSWSTSVPPALATVLGRGPAEVSVGDRLRDIIEGNLFKVNNNKVRLSRRESSQRVTGLVVNTRVNVDRSFIRQTRAMINNYRVLGPDEAQEILQKRYGDEHRASTPSIVAVIAGRLSHIADIRGRDDQVFIKLTSLAAAASLPIAPILGPASAHDRAVRRVHVGSWRGEYEGSVFELRVTHADGSADSGTAWLVAPGRLATAAHCLYEPEADSPELRPMQASVVWSDGSEVVLDPAAYTKHPRYTRTSGPDVATVSLSSDLARRTRLMPLRDAEPGVGQRLSALGFPGVLRENPTLTLTAGSLQSTPVDGGGNSWLAIDTALHSGMSGGPVIDDAGAVVGVVTGNLAGGGNERPRATPTRYLRDIL